MSNRHIVIMGMKHTGKSTLGDLLSRRTGLPCFDADSYMAELSGKTARELYDEGGASLMQRWETKACEALARDRIRRCIIATGGGLADNADALAVLKEHAICIYIDTPFDVLFARVMASAERDGRLPRFLQGGDPEALFREFFSRRSRTYATMADITIDAGTRSPMDLAEEILGKLSNEQRTDLHRRG